MTFQVDWHFLKKVMADLKHLCNQSCDLNMHLQCRHKGNAAHSLCIKLNKKLSTTWGEDQGNNLLASRHLKLHGEGRSSRWGVAMEILKVCLSPLSHVCGSHDVQYVSYLRYTACKADLSWKKSLRKVSEMLNNY